MQVCFECGFDNARVTAKELIHCANCGLPLYNGQRQIQTCKLCGKVHNDATNTRGI